MIAHEEQGTNRLRRSGFRSKRTPRCRVLAALRRGGGQEVAPDTAGSICPKRQASGARGMTLYWPAMNYLQA